MRLAAFLDISLLYLRTDQISILSILIEVGASSECLRIWGDITSPNRLPTTSGEGKLSACQEYQIKSFLLVNEAVKTSIND